MFQNKKLRLLLVLSVVALLFSCGFNAGGNNTARNKTASLPGWFKNPDSRYPANEYLTATGSGVSSSEAKNAAKAGISEIFKQRIESTEEIRTDVRETQGDQSSFLKKVHQQSQIRVQSSAELIGVKIERTTSKFVDGESKYFALAVLVKREAMNNYLRKYSQALDRLRNNYGQANQTDRPLQKLKYLTRARRAVSKAQAYKNIVEVLRTMGGEQSGQPGGSGQTSAAGSFRERARQFKRSMEANRANGEQQTPSESEETISRNSMELKPDPAKISQEIDQVLNEATVFVQSPVLKDAAPVGDFAPLLRSEIEKAFNNLEFKIVEDKNQASFLVRPNLSISYTTKGQESDVALRWDLSVQISEFNSGRTFGTISQTSIGVGTDKDMAATRTRHYIVKWIKKNLNDMIVNKLFS